jgi:DNA modification methylase
MTEPTLDIAGTRIAVVYRALDTLRLDPRNPRAHKPRQVRQIARSIETFGFNVPILINNELQVIAGHGRVMACRTLGYAEVPTIMLEHLTESQAKAFMIADNRLTEISEWDDRLLAEQLKALSELDLDFTLDVTGFEMGEIDLRIEGLSESAEPDPADEAEAVSSGPPVSRLGDVWLLGRHRVVCGNALDASTYATLMQGHCAAMAFTDPPYNVPIDGHAGGLGRIRHREFPMATGELSDAEFAAFLKTATKLMAQHSVDGALHYICMDWRHLPQLWAAAGESYTEIKNLCVWVKDNAGMGSLYRSQHELIVVAKHGRESHRNNIQLGQFGRYRTNVWCYPAIKTLRRSSEEGDLLALHPTVKPVALVADAILDSTARGDIVLDPFLGSGTPVIAAERTGRRAYGIELDPAYVDTIVRRWERYTGQRAHHAELDQTFDVIASERSAPHAETTAV